MRKLSSIIAAVLLIVSGCFVVSEAEARVCFATDEDCGAGGNFGGMDGLKQHEEACEKAGYTEASCKVGQFKYNCPYKASKLMCCNQDYLYDTCIYPLEDKGTCGNKHKCTCDQTVYKYTESKCSKDNAIVGGASCAEQVLNSSANGLDTNTYYSECRCDRGLYPYTTEMCDTNAEYGDYCTATDVKGNTTQYFASCYCDRGKYPYTAAGCFPFVGDENGPKCSSGGVTYYKSCKSCSGWPAENLDHVGKNGAQPAEDAYEACPYAQTTGYYLILRCDDPGYRVSEDGDVDPDTGEALVAGQKCIPIDCDVAVKEYLKASSSANDSYALFDGTKLVDGNGNTVTTQKIAIVAKDMDVSAGTCSTTTIPAVTHSECATYKCYTPSNEIYEHCLAFRGMGDPKDPYNPCGSNSGVLLTNNSVKAVGVTQPVIGSTQQFCCLTSKTVTDVPAKTETKHGGLKCTKAEKYFSGAHLAKTLTSIGDGDEADAKRAVKVACTKTPTITYTGTSFPYSTTSSISGSKPTLKFFNVNFKFSANTVTDGHTLHFYNSKITVNSSKKLTLKGTTELYKESYYVNPDDSIVDIRSGGYLVVRSPFTAKNYDFNPDNNVGTMLIEVPTDYQDKTMVNISLDEGQIFNVLYLYMYPVTDDYLTDYNTSINFKGPSGEVAANVYTNIYLGRGEGYQTTNWKHARKMFANLSGHLVWNMYNGSMNYRIYLSSGSKITSTNYGTGNYARIKIGNDTKWKYCQMSDYQRVIAYAKHSGCWFSNCCGDCKFRPDKGDENKTNVNIICYTTKSTMGTPYGSWRTSSSNCSCGNQSATLKSGCILAFGDYAQSLLTCGE